jgi:hypothetical protein
MKPNQEGAPWRPKVTLELGMVEEGIQAILGSLITFKKTALQ